MIPWKEAVDAEGTRVIGYSKIDLTKSGCYNQECPMGSFIADAYVDSVCSFFKTYFSPQFISFSLQVLELEEDSESWTYAAIAFVNPGSVRAGINRGEISFADIITTTPFANTVDTLELQGKYIRGTLEDSISKNPQSTMQVSGIKVTYDMKKPLGQRVVELKVLCRLCDVPKYEDINDEEWYRMVMPSFLSNGGDGFTQIKENMRNIK